MESTALVLIDIQQQVMDKHPFRRKKFIENVQQLIAAARESKTDVIYIQHTDKELLEGSAAWALAEPLAPIETETVILKHHSSAFFGTNLKEHLESRGIRTLILAGLQTEFAIDSTCKVAVEFGYSVIIPSGATTTFHSCFSRAKPLIEYYEQGIWAGRYAAVLPMQDVLHHLAQP